MLNSVCQQFHQYQQNKQLPLQLKSLNTKISQHIPMEIQVLTWDMLSKSQNFTILID